MSIAIQIAYLISSILFVLGIKMLNKTKSARQGNRLSALGMFIAILATLVQIQVISFVEIFACIVVGAAIGLYYANIINDLLQSPFSMDKINLMYSGETLSKIFLKHFVG